MSASAAALSAEEYDKRKLFLEDLKTLSKEEHKELFRILKQAKTEYTENSNGIFFDVSKVSSETFTALQQFMTFCLKNRQEFASREEEERTAQEALYNGSSRYT
jgi:ribonuclease HII